MLLRRLKFEMYDVRLSLRICVEPRFCFSTSIPYKFSQTMGARIYSRFQNTCFFPKNQTMSLLSETQRMWLMVYNCCTPSNFLINGNLLNHHYSRKEQTHSNNLSSQAVNSVAQDIFHFFNSLVYYECDHKI